MINLIIPDKNFIETLHGVLNEVCTEYCRFLEENNDKDDPLELAEIFNGTLYSYDIESIHVIVGETGKMAIDWYIQAGMVTHDGDITLVLDPDTINGHWGPKTFVASVIKTLEHENIHIKQRDRMGFEKYSTIPSGYMKGQKLYKKTGNLNDLIRLYFNDPQELMAHGHDIAREVSAIGNPFDILRNIENYRDRIHVMINIAKYSLKIQNHCSVL